MYPASGLKRSLHGIVYQLQLIMLFLHRGFKYNKDFKLAIEMDMAEKFDDVVFRYNGSTQGKWRFLQAKHKQDKIKNKINVNALINTIDGDFSLLKYFFSFYKIRNNEYFAEDELEDFTICTNTDFDFRPKNNRDPDQNQKWENYFSDAKELKHDKILHFEGEQGKERRFKKDTIQFVADEIKSSLNNYFKVVKDDKKLIDTSELDETEKSNITEKKEALAENIEPQENIQLSDMEIFLSNFDAGIDTNLISYIQEFLEKFRFVTDYPDVDKLNSLIGEEVRAKFKLLNVDLATDSFQKKCLIGLRQKKESFIHKKMLKKSSA